MTDEQLSDDQLTLGDQLTGWGKVVMLETRGRSTGRPVRSAVGFIEQADGSLIVAAGSGESDWVRNLAADPACLATIGDRTSAYRAEPVEDDVQRATALAALIMKYGTPAERLGRGPVFRLRPAG